MRTASTTTTWPWRRSISAPPSTTITGCSNPTRAQDGDLDFYVLAGPSAADVTRRFSWLTGGQAFAPKWSLGFGMTSMTIADAPDADARVTAFIETCRRHAIPCDSFHFGSGYTSIGARRYAFNWNRDQVSRSGRHHGAPQGGRHAAGHEPEALPARRPPEAGRGAPEGRAGERRRDRRARRGAVLGRARLPCRLHQSRRARLVARRDPDRAAGLRRRLRLERQQRIRDLGRGRPMRRRRQAVRPAPRPPGAAAADDQARLRDAGGPRARQAALHDHAGRAGAGCSATARPGPATTRPPGRPCGSTLPRVSI